jgi:hypothetical protein
LAKGSSHLLSPGPRLAHQVKDEAEREKAALLIVLGVQHGGEHGHHLLPDIQVPTG